MRRRSDQLFLLGITLLSLPHCGGDSNAHEPVLELGSGEAAFEAVEAGDHLTFSAGSQGGHHVWLSMRAEHMEPGDVRMVLDVIPSAPARSAHTDVTLRFSEAEEQPGWIEFVGWPAQVLDPACAAGKSLELRVSLTDDAGREVSQTLRVVPDPPQLGFSVGCEP